MPSSARTALVTGASRGIGRAIATRLATSGVAVGLTARDPATLTVVADAIRRGGGEAVAAAADVTDWEQVQAASRLIETQVGPIELLVNGAGMAGGGNLWEADIADWWRVIEVNVRGALNWSRALLPEMVERRHGRIVNVAGYVGIRPSGPVVPYAIAKAALIRLTDGLAEQLAVTPVKVFAIAPGIVKTEMTLSLPAFKDFTDWDTPDLAAELVVRIASGDVDALNGRLIHVRDDLDEMLSRIDQIRALDLYQLRLYKRPGERQS